MSLAGITGLSICIPNWNHRRFLPRSVRSAQLALTALERMGVKGEVIVVDDGSRDGSQRALLAMALLDSLNFLDVIVRPENAGLAATRNLALASARFSHVCFLDADNEIIPHNLFLFVRAAAMTQAAVVYGNLIAHDGSHAVRLISNCYVNEDLYQRNFIDAFAIYDVAKIRTVGGFDETLSSHEDWELLLHLVAEGEQIVFVPACLGYYYVVPHSMVQTEAFEHERMRRIFSQRKNSAAELPHLMFHPDIGWL